MSNKMTGLVKWFNADKGFGFILLLMAAKMYSYISLQSRAIATNPWTKVSQLSSLSRMALKAQQQLT